jgi:hypothetical protein
MASHRGARHDGGDADRPPPLPHGVIQLLERYAGSREGRTSDCGPGQRQRVALPLSGDVRIDHRSDLAGRSTVRAPGAPYELEIEGDGQTQDAPFLAGAVEQVLAHEEEAKSAAHELSERYEEINLLYSISEILASFLSMEKATTRILEEVADVLGARRAALWVADQAAATASTSPPPSATRLHRGHRHRRRGVRHGPRLPRAPAHQPGSGGRPPPGRAPGASPPRRGAVSVRARELHTRTTAGAGPWVSSHWWVGAPTSGSARATSGS